MAFVITAKKLGKNAYTTPRLIKTHKKGYNVKKEMPVGDRVLFTTHDKDKAQSMLNTLRKLIEQNFPLFREDR